MKKTSHSFHLQENGKVAIIAVSFLALVMFLSYLYWFA